MKDFNGGDNNSKPYMEQLKPGQYPVLVRDHEKPYIVIKSYNQQLVHKDYKATSEALNSSKNSYTFPGDLLCVYNLKSQSFIINEVVHDRHLLGQIYNIIAYYLNK